MTPWEVYSNFIGKLDDLVASYDNKNINGESHRSLAALVSAADDQLQRLSTQQLRDIKAYVHQYIRRKDGLVISEELTKVGFDVAWHRGLSKLSESAKKQMLYGTGEK